MTARKPRTPTEPGVLQKASGLYIGAPVIHRDPDGQVWPGIVTSLEPPSVTLFMARNERYLDSFEGCERVP